MQIPFLLFDGGDVNLFKSLEAMPKYVESPDIDAYLAIDAKGYKIALSTDRRIATSARIDVVPIARVWATPTKEQLDPGLLHARLVGILRHLEVDVDNEATVNELIRLVEARVGFTQ